MEPLLDRGKRFRLEGADHAFSNNEGLRSCRGAAISQAAPVETLHRDADRNSDVGIPAVEQVIAVVYIGDIDIVVVIPVISPILRPRVNQTDPITLVLEAWVATNDEEGQAVDAESVVGPEVPAVTVVRDAVAVVAAALLPVPVVRFPVLGFMLLP